MRAPSCSFVHARPLLSSALPKRRLCRKSFTVLAVESSADDTCAAIVTSSREVLSNVVVKQNAIHEGYGGIHPWPAIQAHQANMPGAVQRALEEAQMKVTDVDGIAYTRGPGIAGCLSVCSNAAKTLAAALGKPLVGVHHMQAHALTSLLTTPPDSPDYPQYPFLTLLVSGGHTLLLLVTSPTTFKTLATTVDSSIGRAFDKASRLLHLPWGARGPGAALEALCASGSSGEDPAPPVIELALGPAMHSQLAFSYSGLHSAVERYITARGGEVIGEERVALARAFQTAAVAQLEEKVALGLRWCQKEGIVIRHVVASGGVASNAFLRERLRACVAKASPELPVALVFPPPTLCTDNAVMIAWASMHRFLVGDHDDYTIELKAKWDIEDISTSG